MREIGGRLRGERVAMGWTQREVAERLGLKQPNLSAMEKGRVCPTIQILETVCSWRGRSLEWLLFGDAAPEEAVGESEASYGKPAGMGIPVIAHTALDAGGETTWRDCEARRSCPLPEGPMLVEVRGDSLRPLAGDGQVLLVCETPPEDGDIVMVETHDGRRLIKRWWPRDEGRVALEGVGDANRAAPLDIARADVVRVWRVLGVIF